MIGGMSWESSAHYCRLINERARANPGWLRRRVRAPGRRGRDSRGGPHAQTHGSGGLSKRRRARLRVDRPGAGPPRGHGWPSRSTCVPCGSARPHPSVTVVLRTAKATSRALCARPGSRNRAQLRAEAACRRPNTTCQRLAAAPPSTHCPPIQLASARRHGSTKQATRSPLQTGSTSPEDSARHSQPSQ